MGSNVQTVYEKYMYVRECTCDLVELLFRSECIAHLVGIRTKNTFSISAPFL